MFSVPGNKYEAVQFLASGEGKSIRDEVGISETEFQAIRVIADHVAAASLAANAMHEGKTKTECERLEGLIDRRVRNSKGVDDCDVYSFGSVRMRIFENTGTNSVNVSVDTE
jgi:hypothetical protein